MAMVHIGKSKRFVVDANARRFGNKRHTGTFPFKEIIKSKSRLLVQMKKI
jgi:hypothetical protein